jgi:radical SAM superfamily enzyme YgiQ (UPF0313 family)
MQDREPIVVYLVQQGIWNMPLESMPLASGYLKAAASSDPRLQGRVDIRIYNFRGGVTLMQMANDIFSHGAPDIIALSVLGWNFRQFGALAETFKQMNPDGWVIFGGTHVANQGERAFRLFPDIDVIVDGEGELVFCDLLDAYRRGISPRALGEIAGISYQDAGGGLVTMPRAERIENLDIIPSPFLTGAISLTDDVGRFPYDVALMETNRGCPYKCSFCYWGGAVGQRVRAFSRERLRAELELFAKLRVHTIVLCDANFGMLPVDAEFVADLIAVRDQYGYPRALETSWAKNKSKVFFDIVQRMKRAGLRSSFTLALQTLDDTTLSTMNRRNMKVNDWEDLAGWLKEQGLDCYAELIWGAPGETVDSFMKGYERLSRHVSRIAVYPLHLLPNTEYSEKKSEYGIVSVRGDADDFEYLLAHNTMTFADNQFMKRFLFWTRVMAENAVLRHIWIALRELTDVSQPRVLRNLDEWIAATDNPAAAPLRTIASAATSTDVAYGDAVSYLYGRPEARTLLRHWWTESVCPALPAAKVDALSAIFEYDLITQPGYRLPGSESMPEELPVVQLAGDDYFHRPRVSLEYDVPGILAELRAGRVPDLVPSPRTVDLYYKVGAENFIGSTNHEEIVHFMGMTADEIFAAAGASVQSQGTQREETDIAMLLSENGGCS